jgi:hypothetical protein
MRVRLGWLIDREFALADVADVAPDTWPVLGGLGLRSDLRRLVAVVGSYNGIVKVSFRAPQPVRVFIKVGCTQLFLSMKDPTGFIEAVREGARQAAPGTSRGSTSGVSREGREARA